MSIHNQFIVTYLFINMPNVDATYNLEQISLKMKFDIYSMLTKYKQF